MANCILLLAFVLALPGAHSARVTTTTHLNVRTGPGLTYSRLFVAKPGMGLPALERQGKWLKVQLLQFKDGRGYDFYIHADSLDDTLSDSVTVRSIDLKGQSFHRERLPRSLLRKTELPLQKVAGTQLAQVHILREGWVFAGFTRSERAALARSDSKAMEKIVLTSQPEKKRPLNWGYVKGNAPLYLRVKGLKQVGQLDSGTVVQILGEENAYLKVQVSSSDLKDTLFVDLNQYYDINSGDTATLVLGNRDTVRSLGSIRKEQLRFDKHRAFFGPGISRLVPVDLDLPLLLDASKTERFHSLKEMAAAVKGKKETHPKFFFPQESANGLVKLTREGLESVISPKWFLEGNADHFIFGLSLKTVVVRESNRNPQEYLFLKFVLKVLEAYRTSLSSLEPFTELVVEVEYMQPGIQGTALLFKTISYRIPLEILHRVDQGVATFQDLFHQATIRLSNENS